MRDTTRTFWPLFLLGLFVGAFLYAAWGVSGCSQKHGTPPPWEPDYCAQANINIDVAADLFFSMRVQGVPGEMLHLIIDDQCSLADDPQSCRCCLHDLIEQIYAIELKPIIPVEVVRQGLDACLAMDPSFPYELAFNDLMQARLNGVTKLQMLADMEELCAQQSAWPDSPLCIPCLHGIVEEVFDDMEDL